MKKVAVGNWKVTKSTPAAGGHWIKRRRGPRPMRKSNPSMVLTGSSHSCLRWSVRLRLQPQVFEGRISAATIFTVFFSPFSNSWLHRCNLRFSSVALFIYSPIKRQRSQNPFLLPVLLSLEWNSLGWHFARYHKYKILIFLNKTWVGGIYQDRKLWRSQNCADVSRPLLLEGGINMGCQATL